MSPKPSLLRKWRVTGQYRVDFQVVVEAESREEAANEARGLGSDLLEDCGFEDIDIDSVDPVKS